MKKTLTLALSCLCLISVYGQDVIVPNGEYVLEKAELFVRNANTQEVVEHKVITDTATIDAYSLHEENIFTIAEIKNGTLSECVLPDGNRYIVDQTEELKPAAKKEELESIDKDRYMYNNRSLRPYTFQIEGQKLIVSFFKYPFGVTNVDFTMEAELIITMTKVDK